MTRLVAIYGSPRRKGNTAALLARAVAGARDAGAEVQEFVLRDLKISPCLEIYKCKSDDGRCAIKDDFETVRDAMLAADGLMIASPIFFYTVGAHTKALMDRCQSLWVKKYWIDGTPPKGREAKRLGLFISAGATRGKKLFDGALLTMKYFMDTLDMKLWGSLLYRELDLAGEVESHPDYLAEANQSGRDFAAACQNLRISN
ncbi:MAG: flavodoxin family protein [Desulfococcaceae bacterium]